MPQSGRPANEESPHYAHLPSDSPVDLLIATRAPISESACIHLPVTHFDITLASFAVPSLG